MWLARFQSAPAPDGLRAADRTARRTARRTRIRRRPDATAGAPRAALAFVEAAWT